MAGIQPESSDSRFDVRYDSTDNLLIMKNLDERHFAAVLPAVAIQYPTPCPFAERRCFRCSGRQIIVLIVVSLASISLSQSISLFPPFYPKLAEEKGASASVYGFVLGSNCLVMFLMTPIIGKHINTLGLKFSLTCGMFINGICCICSGFLDEIAPGVIFITMSIVIRVIHALGNAAYITSSFAIMAIEFPSSVAKIFGFTRILLNVGFLIGPVIGGALYQFSGYRMPFLVLGCFQCLTATLAMLLHPSYQHNLDEQYDQIGGEEQQRMSIFDILSIPSIWISFGCFVVSTFTNGFLVVTLEPQILRQFFLTPLVMGILFGLKDGIGGLSSPAWGWISDNTTSVKPFIIVCAIISGCSLFLLNPPSFASFKTSFPITVTGLVLCGIGSSGEQVMAVVDSFRQIFAFGHQDDPNLLGCIAGLWSSLCALGYNYSKMQPKNAKGRFLSRSLSGILVDHFGHVVVTMLVCGLNLLLAVITIIYICLKLRSNQRQKWTNLQMYKSFEFEQSQTHAVAKL